MELLGVYLESNYLNLALVRKEKGSYHICLTKKIKIDEEDPLLLNSKLKKIAGLSTSAVLIRHLDMPIANKRTALKTLPFQLDALIPYPLEEALILSLIEVNRLKKQTAISLFCSKRKHYDEELQILKNFNLDPEWVSYIPQALYRFAKRYTDEKEFIIMHMGEETTQIIAVVEDKLSYATELDIGKNHFFEAIAKDHPLIPDEKKEYYFNSIDLSNLEGVNLEKIVNRFQQELDRTFYFLFHKKEGRKLETLFFLKEFNFLSKFKRYIEDAFDFPLQTVGAVQEKTLFEYAIPIGLAFDAFASDSRSLQFRHYDLPKTMQQSVVKKLSFFALASTICALCIGLFSFVFTAHKENMLNNRLKKFVNHYEKQILELSSGVDSDSFFANLSQIEKKFSKVKKPIGYYVNPISVSSILSSLSKYDMEEYGLKLESIDYVVEEAPMIATPATGYRTEITLFVKGSEEKARQLFEKIQTAEPWIVPSPKPIVIAKEDGYELKFVIKNNA